jgi:integrase
MALLIECPRCLLKQATRARKCRSCDIDLTKVQEKTYYIDFYYKGCRKRERIGTSKRLAETVLRKRKVEIAEGRYLDRKKEIKTKFQDLSKWYLALEKIKRKRSYQRDCASIGKLNDYFGKKVITEITPKMVEDYKTERLAQMTVRGNVTKPATLNRELACIRHMFNLAIRDGKAEKNPLNGVSLEKENNKRDRVLSEEEYRSLMDKAPSYLAPIITVAYHTGMRKSEILFLQWDRVDMKNGFIRLRPEDTKNNEARAIPLNNELTEIFKSTIKCLHHDYVFTRNNKPIKHIRKAFEKACVEAGIENFTFHDFRHTFVTRKRIEGHDPIKIMKVVGHKDVSMYLRYNTVMEEELKTLNTGRMDTNMDTKKFQTSAANSQPIDFP